MIETNRQGLINALKRCAAVAPAKSTQPNICHVLLQQDSGALSYTATNLRSTISGKLASVGDKQAFSVNVRDLLGALDVLQGDMVKLSTKDTKLHVKGANKREFKLRTLPAEEYPKVENHDLSSASKIGGPTLRTLLKRAAFSAAPDSDDRDFLKAVRVFSSDGKITALATDGRRAAMCSAPFDGTIDAVIPGSAIRLLLDSTCESIALGSHGSSVVFGFGSEQLATLMPSQPMPPVERGFEQRADKVATVDPKALAESLSAVKQADNAGDVLLTFRSDAIRLDARGESQATDELDVACEHDASVGIVASFLTDALAACDGPVDIFFREFPDAVFLECAQQKYVIMPLIPDVMAQKKAKE